MNISALGGGGNINFYSLVEDFKTLDPNDPGLWPWAPRLLSLVLLFLLICLGGWWFLWADQITELDEKQKEEERLKAEFIDKKKQAVNLDVYTQQLAKIDRSFGALLKQLPQKSEIDSLLAEVNQAGLGRGLQFELFRPSPEQVKDFYAELPVAIKLTGAYHDFGAFAADIAKLPRIVTLNDVSVAPNSPSGSTLTLDATLKTFRYLDEAEAIKGSKGKGAVK